MKTRPFEIAVLGGFAALFVIGLIFINIVKPEKEEPTIVVGEVDIWGTVPAAVFTNTLRTLTETDENFRSVTYRYFDPRTFDNELVNAIAEGRGPDLVFMSHTRLVKQLPKLSLLSYENFPLRAFKDTYVDGAELYTLPNGIAGLPVAVDPLVLYWNRDSFSSNGFATSPTTWEKLVNQVVPALVKRDFNREILFSAIALGEYRNVNNAFAILSALMHQGGSQMVTTRVSNERTMFSIALNSSISNIANPGTNALEFYTSFATANNPLYTWNRSQPQDVDMFASQDLAMYLGKASEYKDIKQRNPNLNFDIAELPQSEFSSVKRTYGDFYAFHLLKTADNPTGALNVMYTVAGTDGSFAKGLAQTADFAPAHRSTIEAGTTDPVDRIRHISALYSRGWYNPAYSESETILREMVESVLSSRLTASRAISDAMVRLQQHFSDGI